MTLDEIKQWVKEAKWVDTTREWPDSCGNEEEKRIYTYGDDSQLWAIDSCNGHITEKYGEKGYIRDEYEPRKVKAISRIVTLTEYEDIE